MNALTFPILKLLADGKFHSGEDIAQQLKVSRATVWNALQDAGTLGIEIFSVRGRGYKLPQAVTLLDQQAVLSAMGEERAWFKLEVHDYLESTNTYLMKKLSSGQAHTSCVAANLQTNGRGRRGRTWQAGLGASLTFSLLWRFQCGAAALSGLSLAVGVALIRALHHFGITQAQLKWPNDILVDHEKLAGILIELQGDMEGPSTAVIGIGVNLNLSTKIKQQIDQPAIDLASAAPQTINPNELLGVLLNHLADVLRSFEQQGFTSLRDEWTKHHAYHHQQVRMLMPDGREISGVVQDITEDGNLLVETTRGLQKFASGEISLRGVN
ncbi:MAG: bifunctional biotin--[acetyl-CoA-carboxylase] ligase/biotin operon repressor BirA [Methylotenera sp.]|uniref:bifunctional biotin--[acetyl-CoA-carboxylase] ligase/biotin operon repressor BirA n=1 Tax=Methylotenera sp. TaxID=2051956 RepID=UPI0027226F9C|nr:bifunctional biotin--[acetyl-CoA-carboxylase] ligase/biotin operon repressor BirA [Methylotenera sp.]MDO9393023.1 bifunctional biotin--[acetyl-CoA-carboxylase] ligase/biotin operon repressor BirA [Methylotenera sp.]